MGEVGEGKRMDRRREGGSRKGVVSGRREEGRGFEVDGGKRARGGGGG